MVFLVALDRLALQQSGVGSVSPWSTDQLQTGSQPRTHEGPVANARFYPSYPGREEAAAEGIQGEARLAKFLGQLVSPLS